MSIARCAPARTLPALPLTRHAYAARILRRCWAQQYFLTYADLLPHQWTAEYHGTTGIERGVATKFLLPDGTGRFYWLFQSPEVPTPARVASYRLVLSAHLDTQDGRAQS